MKKSLDRIRKEISRCYATKADMAWVRIEDLEELVKATDAYLELTNIRPSSLAAMSEKFITDLNSIHKRYVRFGHELTKGRR
jgi:hypothetical protein